MPWVYIYMAMGVATSLLCKMEEQGVETSNGSSEYKTIGGHRANLTRRPSGLITIHERIRIRSRALASDSTSSSPIEKCSPPDDVGRFNAISKWDEEEVIEWLHEVGYAEYESLFRQHAISNGRILMSLEQSHLLEMGVSKVGHRLDIMEAIHQLKKDAGLIVTNELGDLCSLMKRLDATRSRNHIKAYPKRIILIRHGESQGNIDSSLYSHVPDPKLELTERGRQQALEAGEKLKEMIGSETVTFYVSPFLRSRQTYEHIRKSFQDEQVLYLFEDPRIREQEWGNFQKLSEMAEIRQRRRTIGSFYYRFPNGESGSDVYDRVSTFLETMYRDMEKGGCGQNTIIVSHGLFCRLFLTRYYHWSIEKFHKIWNFKNCQFAVMELQPSGGYVLKTTLRSDP